MKTKSEKLLPKMLPGTVCRQWKKCGKANCHCRLGQLHGPYYYRFFRVGRVLQKRYVRPGELAVTQAACVSRRENEGECRRELSRHRGLLRHFQALLRDTEGQTL
jgi:hypothetical protein